MTDLTSPKRLSLLRAMCRTGVAKAIREDCALSLREIGVGVGVSQVTVYRWENGVTRPSGEKAERYLKILEDLSGIER